MQFPKLTPLQKRLAACIATLLLLIVVFLSLSPPSFAYAAELDSFLSQDHNHHRIQELLSNDIDWGEEYEGNDVSTPEYQAEFAGFDRSIIGRADLGFVELKNNLVAGSEINANQTQQFVFLKASLDTQQSTAGNGLPPGLNNSGIISKRDVEEELEFEQDTISQQETGLEKRQATNNGSTTVYISLNTCTQPINNGSLTNNATTNPIPQLTFYVSNSDQNQSPGPGQPSDQQTATKLTEGFGQLTIQATGNVYIGVYAPASANGTAPKWTYQISASVDNYYQYSTGATFSYVLDTDSTTALISTFNLTTDKNGDERQAWLDLGSSPPFSLFVFNNTTPELNGLRRSYCGLSRLAPVGAKVTSSITTRNFGALPKQQFYVEGLKPGQSYSAYLAYKAASTEANASSVIGGGGQVWSGLSFNTKTDGNCQVIWGLNFCSDVAYAVPSNLSTNLSTLANYYDHNAESLYQNFSVSLQQVACNTTVSAQYSLARNCTDCSRDYKNWLCAVTIPRCDDIYSITPELMPRGLGQATLNGTQIDLAPLNIQQNDTQLPWFKESRLPQIDIDIRPGPYKELLPCMDLCYDIVRSCPAVMGFACPRQVPLWNKSYAIFDSNLPGSCNYVGRDPPVAFGMSPGNIVPTIGLVATALLVHLILVW